MVMLVTLPLLMIRLLDTAPTVIYWSYLAGLSIGIRPSKKRWLHTSELLALTHAAKEIDWWNRFLDAIRVDPCHESAIYWASYQRHYELSSSMSTFISIGYDRESKQSGLRLIGFLLQLCQRTDWQSLYLVRSRRFSTSSSVEWMISIVILFVPIDFSLFRSWVFTFLIGFNGVFNECTARALPSRSFKAGVSSRLGWRAPTYLGGTFSCDMIGFCSL